MKYGFGVDLGGTTVKMSLFSTDGTLLEKWFIDTDTSNGGRNIPGDIARSILADMKKYPFAPSDYIGIGIGVPGQIHKDGSASAVNLSWDHMPLLDELTKITGLRSTGGNDANMAALGEYWMGGGKGYSSLILVTLGTGVGGGIIIDGKCLNGAHGAGGELGHIPIEPGEKRQCACGSRGCLEQYASATGNVRIATELLAATDEPSTLRSVPKLDAKSCWDAAIAGDPLAMRIADVFSDYLGRGLAAAANIVDPEIILLGGGVSHAGDALLTRVRKSFEKYAFPACKKTPIGLATLSNDAGIYGAFRALLV